METQEYYSAVRVWDWQTRILHWLNAILVITLAIFGSVLTFWVEELDMSKQGRAILRETHGIIGYFFIATFILRLIWGFLGNKYIKWRDIIPYTREKRQAVVANIKWYLSGFKTNPPVVLGHNALASLFYMPLFVVLISQAVTGLTLAGLAFNFFPASLVFGGWDEAAKEDIKDVVITIHALGFFFIIFFFAAHIGGLIVHEIGEKTGLFSSMIHGRKYLPKE